MLRPKKKKNLSGNCILGPPRNTLGWVGGGGDGVRGVQVKGKRETEKEKSL